MSKTPLSWYLVGEERVTWPLEMAGIEQEGPTAVED